MTEKINKLGYVNFDELVDQVTIMFKESDSSTKLISEQLSSLKQYIQDLSEKLCDIVFQDDGKAITADVAMIAATSVIARVGLVPGVACLLRGYLLRKNQRIPEGKVCYVVDEIIRLIETKLPELVAQARMTEHN